MGELSKEEKGLEDRDNSVMVAGGSIRGTNSNGKNTMKIKFFKKKINTLTHRGQDFLQRFCQPKPRSHQERHLKSCLLYTSDAADDPEIV